MTTKASARKKCGVVQATIPLGESLSSPINCKPGNIMRIYAPSLWTDANLTFQVSEDNMTWCDVFLANGFELTSVVVPNCAVVNISTDVLLDDAFVRLRSGTRMEPVAQKSVVTFTIVLGA